MVGVRDAERLREQDLLLDVDMAYDATEAITGDALPDALDYSAVAGWCSACLRASRFQLLERACAVLADGLLNEFASATEVTVTLKKPAALAEGDFAYAAVQRVR